MNQASEAGSPRQALTALLRPKWKAVALLATTSLASGMLEAAFLVTVTRMAFSISEGTDIVGLGVAGSVSMRTALAVALGFVVLRAVSTISATWQSARLSASVTGGIRRGLASAFLRASWSAQHGGRSGRLQELLTTFAQQGAFLVTSTTNGIAASFSLLALLGSAVAVDPAAALVLIVAVVTLGVILRPLRSAIRRQAKSTASTGMEFATALSELSQLDMEMHVFGVQPQTEARVMQLVNQNETTQRKLRFLQGLVPALYTSLAYLAVIGALGAINALNSDLASVGAVMLIMLRSLSYGQGVQTASASINGTLPFLTALEDELTRFRAARLIDGERRVESLGAIEAVSVSFEYEPQQAVLRAVDFRIEPREMVGIVGPSGGGKSTLVRLLLGLRDPTTGGVLAAGHSAPEITRSQWNRMVTFVPQQAHLLAGTVAQNIRFLREGIDQQDIERAARLANLHEDILRWEDGYEHQVGEQGSHLSGGQQQRLIIARALVEHPELLILDEPTSALDVQSEFSIRETLDKLREHMTIVIVAHRLSTLERCDRIMVIQDGELKAFDTPEELERTSKFYRDALSLSGLRR